MSLRVTSLTPPIAPSDKAAEPRPAAVPATQRRFATFLGLSAILIVGSGLRAWMLLYPELCHESDVQWFVDWTRSLFAHGLKGFYERTRFCDYPPLGLLIFYAVGHLAALFDATLSNEDLLRSLLKVPACLADIGIALMLFLEGRRLLGSRLALGASALYFLNPLVFYNSAYWGQIDSIHTALVMLALVLVSRRRWGWSGAALTLALAQKFQSVAFAPLIIFETFRVARWRGIGVLLVAAVATAAPVGTPFALNGVLDDVLQRGYVHVVGQYTSLSHSAYNIWHLVADPDLSDTAVPTVIVRYAAQGASDLRDDATWLLRLNWRVIGLAAYALTVAVILTVYSFRPGPIARFGAAGLLGLAFFLIPTEMHERYSLPAAAFLALWAVSGAWKERAYFLLSAALLLNLTPYLSADQIARQIAAINVVIFVAAIIWLALPSRWLEPVAVVPATLGDPSAPRPGAHGPALAGAVSTGQANSVALLPTPLSGPAFDRRAVVLAAAAVAPVPDPPVKRSVIILAFQTLTISAVIAVLVGGAYVASLAYRLPEAPPPEGTVYLGSLTPIRARQGYGKLTIDRSVAGGLLHLGDRYYLHGLGTHAASTIEYAIPDGVDTFEAVAGIDRAAGPDGSATFAVRLDERDILTTPVMRYDSPPVVIKIPVAGAERLTLRVDPTPDRDKSDHANWAAARFTRSSPTTQPEALP